MTEQSRTGYADATALLLPLGKLGDYRPETWPDYSARFGFGQEHVPDLIRMATDPFLNAEAGEPETWAPVHAWRTLGQLRAEAAIAPLLSLFKTHPEDDAVRENMPDVLGMIGPAAIAPVMAFIDEQKTEEWHVVAGMRTLKDIALRYPAQREECLGFLTGMLERHAEMEPMVNGFLISDLLDLKAVDAIDAIRAAFDAGTVDLSVSGDKEDVEIELGLRENRSTPKPRYHAPFPEALRKARRDDENLPWGPREPRQVTKIGRNDPCPCGSGKKYKKCCLAA